MPARGTGAIVGLLVAPLVAGVAHAGPSTCDEECAEAGRCTLVDGDCWATDDRDCRRASLCIERGRCTARERRCVATSHDDCMASVACRHRGDCAWDPDDQECDDGYVMWSPAGFWTGLGVAGLGAIHVAVGSLLYVGGRAGGGSAERSGPRIAAIGGGGVAAGALLMAIFGQPTLRTYSLQVDARSTHLGLTLSGRF